MSSAKDPESQKLLEHETDISKEKAAAAASFTKAAYSCALYASCSVSMVLVNKSLASR